MALFDESGPGARGVDEAGPLAFTIAGTESMGGIVFYVLTVRRGATRELAEAKEQTWIVKHRWAQPLLHCLHIIPSTRTSHSTIA